MQIERSGKLLEVHAELVSVAVGEQIGPGDFAMLETGHAAELATERGFNAGGDLVVNRAVDDAVNEAAVLLAVGLGEIVIEVAAGGELALLGGGLEGVLPAPGLRADDVHGAGVRDVGSALLAEETQAGFKHVVVAELLGGEGEADVVGIEVVDLVVIPAVAGVGEDVAAAGGDGLDGMRAKEPVAEIDDVDVLLDKDVAGESAIPEPVAEAVLVVAGADGEFLFRCGRPVVAVDGGDLAEGAGVNLLCDGGDGRSHAALEADIDALRGLDALGDFKSLVSLMNIDADGLLAVDVLAGVDGRG